MLNKETTIKVVDVRRKLMQKIKLKHYHVDTIKMYTTKCLIRLTNKQDVDINDLIDNNLVYGKDITLDYNESIKIKFTFH